MQNPIQTMLQIQIKFFFKKINFLLLFRPPILHRWEKWSQQKKTLFLLFYSAKSISNHFTISELFHVFFRKIIFFTVLTPILQKWEKWSQQKINLRVLSYGAKTISDHFRNSIYFQIVFKNLNFSQYASLGKCVEYAKLNTTQNQRKICKIYAKFNAKYVYAL